MLALSQLHVCICIHHSCTCSSQVFVAVLSVCLLVYNFLLLFYVWVWFLYYYVGIVSEKPLVPCSGHGFDVTITSCHDTSCIATETKTSDFFVFPV